MRWDLPDGELGRLREAIDGKVHLDEDDLGWIDATAARPVPSAAPVPSPMARAIAAVSGRAVSSAARARNARSSGSCQARRSHVGVANPSA